MFIYVVYKDAPELSLQRRRSSELDNSVERTLLVNPDCPIRTMLEYIRKKCRLSVFTQFDLCDESGVLMGLFALPTYSYADEFEHKKTYYLIVLKPESEKSDIKFTVLPQLNHANHLYVELKARVKKYMLGELTSPMRAKSSTLTASLLAKSSTATTKSKQSAKSASLPKKKN